MSIVPRPMRPPPLDTFVRYCEACDETDMDGNAFCEGCDCCGECCNCTPSDCDCDVCEIRRADNA